MWQLVLAISVSACGRVSIDLLPVVAESMEPDAAGVLVPIVDLTEVVDAGAGLGDAAAVHAASDAGVSRVADAGMHDAGGLEPSVAVDAGAIRADAGLVVDAGDGAVSASSDGGVSDAGSVAGACAGQAVLGVCWYLGAEDTSCTDECGSHGGTDSRAMSVVGTSAQGGSEQSCAEVLTALGRPGAVGTGMRADDVGLGCHVWSDGARWWLASRPGFDVDAHGPGVRLACGCLR